MDMDEYIFKALEASNRKWVAHAAESEDANSDIESRKGSTFAEMKKEIALQNAQITSQQEELKLQKEQMARQRDDITLLREAVQKLQESQAAAAAASSESIPQCAANEIMTTHAGEWDDTRSDADVGKGSTMNDMKMRTHSRKIRLRFRRDRSSKSPPLQRPAMQSRNRGVTSTSGYIRLDSERKGVTKTEL